MENKKNSQGKKLVNENSIEGLYTKYFGEYQPDKFSPKSNEASVSKESDMDEGKLFTKFILKK